jgi:diguanylate cyclase (GGDEF)-like protein
VTTLSDLESWSNELARQATHDELTGLANRPHLFACVEAALEAMRDAGRQFAVLFLDLDGFKEVNDELGHEAGDAVLQGIAERLGRQVRGHDVLARLGGDEFVIVLNDLADPDHALKVADRVCEAAAAPFSIGSSVVRLGASVGIAYARPDDSADRLLNTADRVMYEAKRMGGNRFVVSRPDAA